MVSSAVLIVAALGAGVYFAVNALTGAGIAESPDTSSVSDTSVPEAVSGGDTASEPEASEPPAVSDVSSQTSEAGSGDAAAAPRR